MHIDPDIKSEALKLFLDVLDKTLGAGAAEYLKYRISRWQSKPPSLPPSPASPGDRGAIVEAGKATLEQRAESRIGYVSSVRQSNIEYIMEATAIEIAGRGPGAKASGEFDHEWNAHFWTSAQDVSNEKLRQLWAKILAEKVLDSAAVSKRTLSVLRGLSAEEAELFERITPFVLTRGIIDEALFLRPPQTSFNEGHLLELVDANLLSPGMDRRWQGRPHEQEVVIGVGKDDEIVLKFDLDSKAKEIQFTGFALTKAAEEIFPIVARKSDEAWLESVVQALGEKGYMVRRG